MPQTHRFQENNLMRTTWCTAKAIVSAGNAGTEVRHAEHGSASISGWWDARQMGNVRMSKSFQRDQYNTLGARSCIGTLPKRTWG